MAEQQHRATARQWRDVKALAYDIATYSCIFELLHRIEALESAAKPTQPNHLEKPHSSLVERVAAAITGDGGPMNWRSEARAAIREVAAWLRENPDVYFAPALVFVLEKEAERRST